MLDINLFYNRAENKIANLTEKLLKKYDRQGLEGIMDECEVEQINVLSEIIDAVSYDEANAQELIELAYSKYELAEVPASPFLYIANTINQQGGTGANLPSMTGNAGKYLYTDGATAYWKFVSISEITNLLSELTRIENLIGTTGSAAPVIVELSGNNPTWNAIHEGWGRITVTADTTIVFVPASIPMDALLYFYQDSAGGHSLTINGQSIDTYQDAGACTIVGITWDGIVLKCIPDYKDLGTAPTPTTPAAPTVSGDDTADTLTASHAFGPTEIVVSENGGSFTQYTGAINVGNVARAAGYWLFKVKAALGRNESATTPSPAFTVFGTPPPPITPLAPTNPVTDDVADTFSADIVAGYTNVSDYEIEII